MLSPERFELIACLPELNLSVWEAGLLLIEFETLVLAAWPFDATL